MKQIVERFVTPVMVNMLILKCLNVINKIVKQLCVKNVWVFMVLKGKDTVYSVQLIWRMKKIKIVK